MQVDYEFCKKAKIIPMDLLIWLDIELEDDFTYQIGDRKVQYITDSLIQISEPLKTFDRWANSVDVEYDLLRRSERKQFIDHIEQLRNQMEQTA